MRAVDLIEKKRDGNELAAGEIRWLVGEYVAGRVPDYQMAAFLMAVYFRGMSEGETVALTQAMADSGDQIDLSSIPGIKVDKHSTGGVGDTVTLVLVPLMAAAGLVVAKLSGRSLGHTGGTIDKLEAIPGLRTELTLDQIRRQAERIGAVVADHTADVVPADRLLYELRDVTATVPSLPLIAGSVLSKKLAGGADAIVLDVKCGDGAFMRTESDARALAETLVRVGNRLGKRFSALITAMDEPLGTMAGNALEVRQAIDVLHGTGPADLREVTLALGAELLVLAGEALDPAAGKAQLVELISSGKAWAKFRDLVAAQGGDVRAVEEPERLPKANQVVEVPSPASGYVGALRAHPVGVACGLLGAGREVKGQAVDPGAGVELLAKVGDEVEEGQPLARLHVGRPDRVTEAQELVANAYAIGPQRVRQKRLILGQVR
ncbi:MAG: Pyrimidine-nucleoside phosphorylase [Candidatus Bipolaricaulis sibiricus]|uniref:Pyrimidine-nucleoside phosphorylase n=1 Tax=Bipolaricaulis sibiricus TaxID=2501609 RepID=A0A410FVW9_BIPS1|nr:MAG: Pyrimidine-nucleoside phosphorylase [Candidatus Bipolaricaulis sibiricus]